MKGELRALIVNLIQRSPLLPPRFLYVHGLMERAAFYRAIHYAHLRVGCVCITIAGRSHAGELQGNYRWKEEMKGFFGAKRAKIGQEKPLL